LLTYGKLPGNSEINHWSELLQVKIKMHVGLLTVYVEHLHQSGNQLLLVHAAEPPLLSSSRE